MNVPCLRHMHERYQSVRVWIVGFMKKWSWIWIRVFKKALGQFHDYFIECSTKFYYIV
ncbi:hypothetical protein HanRHA438_Chr04g0199881 [Helianthus annuus]|nr:hypothetical protein HanRHA438_Chr04g0199881 [Helianthus annuus]